MSIGVLVVIIDTWVQASSQKLSAFMIGRFILGFGVAISASAGAAYVSEIARPSYCGMITELQINIDFFRLVENFGIVIPIRHFDRYIWCPRCP